LPATPGCFASTTAATITSLPITADGCTAGARSRTRCGLSGGCPRLRAAAIAAVISGIAASEKVIVEGLQRVRPGQVVSPELAIPLILSSMNAAATDAAPRTDRGASSKTASADSKP
jgi:hypothetical protein